MTWVAAEDAGADQFAAGTRRHVDHDKVELLCDPFQGLPQAVLEVDGVVHLAVAQGAFGGQHLDVGSPRGAGIPEYFVGQPAQGRQVVGVGGGVDVQQVVDRARRLDLRCPGRPVPR